MVLNSLCLRYLLLLRTFAMGAQVAALIGAHILLDAPVPWTPILFVMLAVTAITLWSWRRMHSRQAVSEPAIMQQLTVDIVALAILLYYTGGSWNPFVSLFLLPITVAAATLRSVYIWLLVFCAVVCYTLLMFFHKHTLHWVHGDDHFALHIWGMWLGFLLSACIVAFFVARIGAALRVHDRELASARQVAALSAMAAGAAHELGTPLATMAVVTHELQRDPGGAPALRESLAVLSAQVDRCKQILARMAAHAGQSKAESGKRVPVNRYVDDVISEWQALRPEVNTTVAMHGAQPAPQIVADRTLTQALLNVLNNAADASPARVEVDGQWNANELTVQIRDSGRGLMPDFDAQTGKAITSQKPEGMGLGLFLARTTLSRLGGEIVLRNRDDGAGAVADIRLPLQGLLA